MTRLALALLGLALTGCVAAGPSYSPQELAAVQSTVTANNAEARAHHITWVEASQRNAAKAREVAGKRLTPNDELNFAYDAALAAEVDAGRMTPEMAVFKSQERTAEQHAAQQARDDEQRRRIGEAMMIAGQNMQNAAAAARPVSCTSNRIGTYTYTNCN